MFKTVAGGAHGNTRGFNGSLTAGSLQKIFHAVDPSRKIFLDIGFGTGVVLAAALAAGASKAHGYELPGNQANRFIFQAAMTRWSKQYFYNLNLSNQALLEFSDVEEVSQMLNASMFYGYNSLSAINRLTHSKKEQILHSHFGTEWVCGPKSHKLQIL